MNWVTLQIVGKVLIWHVFAAPGFESTIELSEDNTNAAHCRSLPSKEFDALWDCLIYDNDLKEEIFRYMQTALIVSSCQVDASLIGLNRLILLSGPPGKFTLKIQSFKVKLCGCYILHATIQLTEVLLEGAGGGDQLIKTSVKIICDWRVLLFYVALVSLWIEDIQNNALLS